MTVKSIAECSPRSILQYFWPALSDKWSWKSIFGVFESRHFTQVLLYIEWNKTNAWNDITINQIYTSHSMRVYYLLQKR